jgi:hypothetical protein
VFDAVAIEGGHESFRARSVPRTKVQQRALHADEFKNPRNGIVTETAVEHADDDSAEAATAADIFCLFFYITIRLEINDVAQHRHVRYATATS